MNEKVCGLDGLRIRNFGTCRSRNSERYLHASTNAN